MLFSAGISLSTSLAYCQGSLVFIVLTFRNRNNLVSSSFQGFGAAVALRQNELTTQLASLNKILAQKEQVSLPWLFLKVY